MAKTDIGVQYADKEYVRLLAELNKIYNEASVDIQEKMDAFYTRFKKKDELWKKRLKNGEVTQEDYKKWLKGQVFQGKQWEYRKQSIANTLVNANEVAINMVNQRVPNVFQFNGNYAAYQMENSVGVELGFNLYNPATVRELILDDKNILPPKKLNKAKDTVWNYQLIKHEVAKGIIEGEGIPQITKRLSKVIPDRNKSMLTTHARTMVTEAQNKGRLTRFEEARDKGIDMEKEWFSTLDGRTRYTHRLLDRQRKPLDEPFEVEDYKIMYPADPQAHPSLVYNCRCTMNSYIKKYPPQYTTRRDNESKKLIKDMSYQEWEKWKEQNEN
jgi:hypothetical protein